MAQVSTSIRDLDGLARSQQAFGLALSPGEALRLRIDLITAVVMEPGPKTYRLVEVPLAPARFCLKALTGPIRWTG